MAEIVVYQGSENWSAVYADGELQRVGDHYLADEWIREHFGVDTVQSDDFMRGGDYSADVAQSLAEIDAYTAGAADRAHKAAELRAQAHEMLRQAAELDR